MLTAATNTDGYPFNIDLPLFEFIHETTARQMFRLFSLFFQFQLSIVWKRLMHAFYGKLANL